MSSVIITASEIPGRNLNKPLGWLLPLTWGITLYPVLLGQVPSLGGGYSMEASRLIFRVSDVPPLTPDLLTEPGDGGSVRPGAPARTREVPPAIGTPFSAAGRTERAAPKVSRDRRTGGKAGLASR